MSVMGYIRTPRMCAYSIYKGKCKCGSVCVFLECVTMSAMVCLYVMDVCAGMHCTCVF
jgi:hypothetical protein